MRTTPEKQQGFTVVEFTVIVIVLGLLVGGWMKGDSFIAHSEMKATASQMESLRAAIHSFYEIYKAMPGDFTRATEILDRDLPDYANGNGDGIIADVAPNKSLAWDSAGMEEMGIAFQHLALANLLSGVLENERHKAYDWPGKKQGTYFALGYFDLPDDGEGPSHFARLQNTKVNEQPTGGVSPRVAANLDKTHDDGLPNQGLWRAHGITPGSCKQGEGPNATYGKGNKPECVMFLQLVE